MLVPLRSTGEIRVFGADGDFLESHGGIGEGPGEFGRLSAAFARGHTIEAWDPRLARMTRFLPDGEVETVPLQYDGISNLSAALGTTSDGWLVVGVAPVRMDERDQLVVHRFATTGEHVSDEIVTVEGMERTVMGRWSGPVPLSPKAQFAVRADSERLYVGETLTPVIRAYDLSGELRRTIRWDSAREWDPQEAFDRVVRVTREGRDAPFRHGSGISYQPGWPSLAEAPDMVPVFSDFIVDEQGFIWIRPYRPERDAAAIGANVGLGRTSPSGEWTILSHEGVELGSVEIPDGLEPYDISSDAVLGIYRDEHGVESVRVYPLKRS